MGLVELLEDWTFVKHVNITACGNVFSSQLRIVFVGCQKLFRV